MELENIRLKLDKIFRSPEDEGHKHIGDFVYTDDFCDYLFDNLGISFYDGDNLISTLKEGRFSHRFNIDDKIFERPLTQEIYSYNVLRYNNLNYVLSLTISGLYNRTVETTKIQKKNIFSNLELYNKILCRLTRKYNRILDKLIFNRI